jgi:hypothetical protein
MTVASDRQGTADPFFLPYYLRLNAAIGQYTADAVAQDPRIFRAGRADIRYAAERKLYFALVANEELYRYFIAKETAAPLPDVDDLSIWARQIAPYFKDSRPAFGSPKNLLSRVLRFSHRRYGRAHVRVEECGSGKPELLFLVIHPKFVRYLKPIADATRRRYAFLAVDNPQMGAYLAEQGLPRVMLDMTPESELFTRPLVKILGLEFRTCLFDSCIIQVNAIRRALRDLAPRCVVVPEGNADIYELVNQAGKSIAIPTLCIQQGWAPIVHPGFRNMSYDRMCVWGGTFADLLSPHNRKQTFAIVGNHMIYCERQGDVAKRSAIAFFLQNGAHWITARAWSELLKFIEWTARQFPIHEVRVREHPGEGLKSEDVARLSALPNVKLMPPAHYPLADVLSDCRCAVAINSTVVLEAIAGGIVPLILDVCGFGRYSPDVGRDGAAIEVRDFCDARQALKRLMDGDAYAASFAAPLDHVRKGLFARHGQEAVQAIAEEIDAIARK